MVVVLYGIVRDESIHTLHNTYYPYEYYIYESYTIILTYSSYDS